MLWIAFVDTVHTRRIRNVGTNQIIEAVGAASHL